MLGWSPEDLAEPGLHRVRPSRRRRRQPSLRAPPNGTRLAPTRSGFENRLRCRDGSYRWIEWTSQRRGDLIYSTGRDVTVRNTETAELAAYVEMTKAIFAAAADLIVIVDRDW